jgi:hypothetical protein
LREAFMGRQIRPDARSIVNAAERRAAEHGLREVQG